MTMQTWFRNTKRTLVAMLVALSGFTLLTANAEAQVPAAPPAQAAPPATSEQPAPPAAGTTAPTQPQNGQQPPATTAPATPAPAATPAATLPTTTEVASQPLVPQALVRRLDAIVPELERLTKGVERVSNNDEALERQRAETETLRSNITTLRQSLMAPLQALGEQLRKLGPRPKPPAPPEAPAIEAERARLEKAVSEVDAAVKTLDLTDERARQLVGRIQGFRNSLITGDILKRSPSPLQPSVWIEVAGELPRAGRQIVTILSGWSDLIATRSWQAAVVLLLAALAHILLTIVRSSRVSRLMPEPPEPEPGSVRRLTTATRAAVLTVAPVFVAALLLYGGVRSTGLDNQLVAPLLDAAMIGFTIYIVTRAIALAVLTPRHPSWRVIDITSPAAARLVFLIGCIGAVLGLDVLLDALVRHLYLPPAVGIVKTHISTTAIAGLIGAIALTGLPPASSSSEDRRSVAAIASWLKLPLLLLAVGLVAASASGYVGLATFVARQSLALATGVVAVMLIHVALRAIIDGDGRVQPAGSAGSESLLSRLREGIAGTMLRQLLTLFAALFVMSLMMLSWGFSTGDLAGLGKALLFGFKIGDYTISLWRLIVACVLFAGLIVSTRLVQRWLSKAVLVPQRMDAGIAHSIDVGIGYLGTTLAALIGLSYAGLDVSHLAIVAGALSVGIGFGLQSIANNFVSGLILLVERPIKVGDWIVVGEHQGHVRKISVRATEIETFDRASVIVPNSQLITGAVQNWTLRNAMGRLTIKISASYDADPETVIATVRTALEGCPTVLRYPAPRVTFTDFGASGLDFTIHAFVSDVAKGPDAQNEIRIAVFKAFKKAKIEIPFPQTDINLRNINLRDIGVLGTFVDRLADARANRSGATGNSAAPNNPGSAGNGGPASVGA